MVIKVNGVEMKIGINWHLRFREEIKKLKEELMLTQIERDIAERKLTKHENNNTRAPRYREDNNVIEISGRLYKTRR